MNPQLHFLLTHLWESSWFALACMALCLALDPLKCPRARHLIAWLGLLKFLLPIAWLARVLNPSTWTFLETPAPVVTSALSLETLTPNEDALFWSAPIIVAVALWALGFAALTALLGFHIVALRRRIQDHTQPADEGWQAEAAAFWRASQPMPRLLFARTDDLPAGVFGWISPVVVVPPHLQNRFNAAEREAFLRHEFQHLYKHDTLWLLLQITLRNLLWMHPLLWWLEHRIRLERELIRDQEVIRKTNNPNSYLSCLMKASKIELHEPRATAVCLNGSPFTRRVKAIARAGRSSVAGFLSAGAGFSLLAAFTVLMLAVQVPAVAGDADKKTADAAHEAIWESMGPEQQAHYKKSKMQLKELGKKLEIYEKKLHKFRTMDNPSAQDRENMEELLADMDALKQKYTEKKQQLASLWDEYADKAAIE